MVAPQVAQRIRRARHARLARRPNPITSYQEFYGRAETVPDIIEFVVSDRYLDRPNLYPRQATMLKVMFLAKDLLTDYDLQVIGEWEEAFAATGHEGCAPKLLERIDICRAQGRSWFREVLGVIGRRGSKGYLGGLAGSFVLWNYMNRPGGPQRYYGIDRDKRLTAIVFAGKKEQARDNQWRDLFNVIRSGPCFAKYISRPQAERLTVLAPSDLPKKRRLERLGIYSEDDLASFEIIPAPSTVMAGRGPTSFMQFYDEFAHVVATGANRDAHEVWDAATPSLDQFGVDAFIYEPSSPWQKTGQFFSNWEKAIELEADGSPAYPEMVMFQLPSWGPYEDWDEADSKPLRPPETKTVPFTSWVQRPRLVDGEVVTHPEKVITLQEQVVPGPTFQPLKRAIQTYDHQMRQLERANPETFAVERRSHWAHSLSQYLDSTKVAEMFTAWNGEAEHVSAQGVLGLTYVAHGDPATSNKRFGWALGHRVWDEEQQMHHAVLDVVRCWEPGDYTDHLIDYDDVMGDIETDVRNFIPEVVSFDQFNVPATIGRLRKFVAREALPKHVQVLEVTRTRGLNWRHYELFKSAINMGLVHAPMVRLDGEVNYASEQGELELRFLEEKNGAVNHPTSGPVQSKDIADAICEVTVALIGAQMATFLGEQFDEVAISGSAPHGTDPYSRGQDNPSDAAARLGAITGGSGGLAARGGLSPARGGVARGMGRR